MIDVVAETARKVGLVINEQKTEAVGVGEDPLQVNFNGKNLESVECFTYLGSKTLSNDVIEKQLSGRIRKDTGRVEKLGKIWQSNGVFKDVKN